jgi:hypothetical protein
MFAAVYHFGPRWPWKGELSEARTLRSTDDFFRMRSLLRRDSGMSLAAIEGLTHDALVAQVSDAELAAERRCGLELESGHARYFEQELSRGEFIPGGAFKQMGDWKSYLGCVR